MFVSFGQWIFKTNNDIANKFLPIFKITIKCVGCKTQPCSSWVKATLLNNTHIQSLSAAYLCNCYWTLSKRDTNVKYILRNFVRKTQPLLKGPRSPLPLTRFWFFILFKPIRIIWCKCLPWYDSACNIHPPIFKVNVTVTYIRITLMKFDCMIHILWTIY